MRVFDVDEIFKVATEIMINTHTHTYATSQNRSEAKEENEWISSREAIVWIENLKTKYEEQNEDKQIVHQQIKIVRMK